eukprot:TRINITY_DN27606_c0_g1_i1.p1 TRINITY_DN27606_c0_g1~~TRINITY_DN27606_c0_g1_i1.p1  ORF type:complete len:296 (-),score=55.20 TRINITY_DN27606_c0_g1_i1:81-968(-)
MSGVGASSGDDDAAARQAWRLLHSNLAGLRGDAKIESFLSEKHPELLELLNVKGAPRPVSLDSDQVKRWFDRKLRGHRSGVQERALLCRKLLAKVRHRAAGWRIAEISRVEEALTQNTSDEGPLICSTLAKELVGSRFEGIWIAREGPGIYRIGEEQQLRVAVQVLDGKLLVHGYFDGEFLHPVRVAIKPFLAEHGPADMRSATDDCDLFGGGGGGGSGEANSAGGVVRAVADAAIEGRQQDRSRSPLRRRSASAEATEEEKLPSGWARKESRSKPGVFYYANEAKGLTQFQRPA